MQSEIKDIIKKINTLPIEDLKEIFEYCQEKFNKTKQSELEKKIISKLKKRYSYYPQLVKFAEGLKINAYNYEKADYMIHCSFEIDFCSNGHLGRCGQKLVDDANDRKEQKDNNCIHLKIFCDGTYEIDDPDIENIEFCIIDNKTTTEFETITTKHFGHYNCFYPNMDNEVIDVITKTFNFDKDNYEIRHKKFFGMITEIENRLELFFRDIFNEILLQ